jgi:glycosyltransferase involved in cell wall biosynthesis
VSNIIEDKIKVIYEGLTLKVNGNNALSKECKLIFPRRRFLLYVGDRRPHKNLRRILELYTGLVKSNCYDGDLIIVGNKTNYDFDVDQYCHDGVICVGNVEDSKLDLYYRNCDALIFMSKYEGFGLPILEAASRKKRIISSDGGALAEIIPSWAYVIKNNDSLSNHYDSLSRYLNAEIDTSDLLEYMHDYRWERVADKILASIADFIAIQVQESPR